MDKEEDVIRHQTAQGPHVSGEFALLGEDGIRFDDLGDVFQGFLAQCLTDLGQGLALSITELEPTLDLIAQDAVFGNEILIAEQEFFIA